MPDVPSLLKLTPHPATPCPALPDIEVRVSRETDGSLELGFVLWGDTARLAIPHPRSPGPADELWRHTCCEAFVGLPGETAYREFNFSPSGQWAAYAFTDTRQRHEAFAPAVAPRIALRRRPDRLELDAHVPPPLLPPAGSTLQLGLTVVVEGVDGMLAYWALRHPADHPDFHHRSGHTLNVPANR